MRNNELLKMFRYSAMIKSAALCATVFGFVAVLLKNSFVIIPEVTEVRLCNILPCVLGIWFGPAAAWGCGIGNLVGDMGGSLTLLSLPGFFANFFSAWIPYKIWGVFGAIYHENPLERPSLKSKNWFLRYLVGGFCSVTACSAILAFSFDLYGSLSAVNTYFMIFLNNISATLLGTGLFVVLSFLPEKILVYWRDQMTGERELAFPSVHGKKVMLLGISCFSLGLLALVYALIHGISFRNPDSLGQILPVTVFVLFTAFQVVLTLRCNWQKTESSDPGKTRL